MVVVGFSMLMENIYVILLYFKNISHIFAVRKK